MIKDINKNKNPYQEINNNKMILENLKTEIE